MLSIVDVCICSDAYVQAAYIVLQYFLLGVSSIYIAQNLTMLVGFLPGKRTFFNAAYFKDVKELKNEHIKRYSDQQVSILHSFFCLFFAGIGFALNYHFQVLPRNIVIWIVFVIFPYLLVLIDYALNRATINTYHKRPPVR